MVHENGPFCARCHEWTEYTDLTVDHIIPTMLGLPSGKYQTPDNRQLLCIDCQHTKYVLERSFKHRVPSRKARYLLLLNGNAGYYNINVLPNSTQ